MRLSVFILSLVLSVLLSGGPASGGSAGRSQHLSSLNATGQAEVAPDWPDCVAMETARLSIPYPMRVMRKPNDRLQKLTVDVRDACYTRSLLWTQGSGISASRLLPGVSFEAPFHDADYLRFGILRI